MTRARNTADQINRVNSSAADATAITIDSSENVLVGKTSSSLATDGVEAKSNGSLFVTRSSATPVSFRRSTDDGSIVNFYKDGTTVGSIAADGGFMSIGTGDVGLVFNSTVNTIHPNNQGTLAGSDGQVDLGYTNVRFKDLYLSGGAFIGGTGAANKLSDYEEGTWTPAFGGDTASGSYSYLEQQGQYVKVGNQVTAWFNLTNIATSSAGSGTVVISGLPFSANWESGFNGENVGSGQFQGFTGLDGDTTNLRISDGHSKITCTKLTGTNNLNSVITPSHKVDSNSDVRGFVTYYTGG